MRVFIERLLAEMKSLGLKRQSDLAKIIGCDKVTINRWVHGKQTPIERVQMEVFQKLDAYRRGEVTGSPLEVDRVSQFIEKKLEEKFAQMVSLGIVPVYVMEKLKECYNRADDKQKRKVEYQMEEMFGDDFPVMLKWIKDVKKEDE